MKSILITAAMAVAIAAGAAAPAAASDPEVRAKIEALKAQQRRLNTELEDTRGLGGRVGGRELGVSANAEVGEVTVRQDPDAPAASAARASTGPQDLTTLPEGERVDFSVTFESGSAFIRAGAEPTLEQLCAVLNGDDSFSAAHFMIIGHADRTGSAEYNRMLSDRRAREVRRWLIRDCGIDSERLQALGVGFDHPLPGRPLVGEAQRRVEVRMTRPGDA